jgi:hypothetical protein
MDVRWVRNVVIIAALIGGFLSVNVMTPSEWGGDSKVLTAILMGICIGQLNLIATWAALAPGNFMVRLPWSLLLAVLMWYALVVGNRIERSYFDGSDAIFLGSILLFGLLVALIPLGIAARVFRWRLLGWSNGKETEARVRGEDAVQSSAPAAEHVPAVAGHGAGSHGAARRRRVDDPLPRCGLLILLVGMAVCNVVVTIPCIWGAYLPMNKLPVIVGGWIAYCALLTGVEYGFFVLLLGPPDPNQMEVILLFYVMNLMQCATVFGVLLIFRALGFRLVRTVPKVTAEQL